MSDRRAASPRSSSRNGSRRFSDPCRLRRHSSPTNKIANCRPPLHFGLCEVRSDRPRSCRQPSRPRRARPETAKERHHGYDRHLHLDHHRLRSCARKCPLALSSGPGTWTSGSSVPAAQRGQRLMRRRHDKLFQWGAGQVLHPCHVANGRARGEPLASDEKSAPKALRLLFVQVLSSVGFFDGIST